MMLVTTKLLVIMRVVMIMMTWMILLVIRKGQTDHPIFIYIFKILQSLIKQKTTTTTNAAATATSSDLSTATTFTADLTTAITTASMIMFTATDHTSTTIVRRLPGGPRNKAQDQECIR